MIIGLPVWTAALDIANSSLAKKVPYSIAFASEHMATDPISIVNQVGNISSISIHDPSDAEAELVAAIDALRASLPADAVLDESSEPSISGSGDSTAPTTAQVAEAGHS